MFFDLPAIPLIREITKNARNKKKQILANPAAAPATPPKPSTAAMIAINKNVIVQLNIKPPTVFLLKFNCYKINRIPPGIHSVLV